MHEIVISLTTIPERAHFLRPTFQSLLDQDIPISKILLNLPRQYRRGGSIDIANVALLDGVEVNWCDTDFGPATKLLPTLQLYKQRKNVVILYCDDDRIYHPDWASGLINLSKEYPTDCITYSGGSIQSYEWNYHFNKNKDKKTIRSKLVRKYYKTLLQKNVRKLESKTDATLVDVAEGYEGVLVRPEFFDDAVFDVPDIIWMVDDVWLSGNMAKKGIKIRKLPPPRKTDGLSWHQRHALKYSTFNGYDRHDANRFAIRHFQSTAGIWHKD